uniref:Uncharacterized protein n=1 Tax=Arundo donax TaxID=35708 RepID=A0A0A9BL67_ARUDO
MFMLIYHVCWIMKASIVYCAFVFLLSPKNRKRWWYNSCRI